MKEKNGLPIFWAHLLIDLFRNMENDSIKEVPFNGHVVYFMDQKYWFN